ncbi:MAG: hypothetical protein WED34_04375 [Planctomycetales bacterium]
MVVPKTLKWFLLLVLLVGCAGGGYAYWVSTHSDERLREGLLDRLAEMAPQWDIRIGRARFDWNRRVHLHDLSIRPRGETAAIVQVPEVIVTLDAERFADKAEIDVRRFELLNPRLDLVRRADGSWNWQKLFPLDDEREKKPLPEWHVAGGVAEVRLEQPGNAPPGVFFLRRAEVDLVPAGRRQFRVRGAVHVDRAGGVSLDGRWNVDDRTWSLDGRLNGLAAGPELVELAAGASLDLHTKIARLHAHLDGFARETEAVPGGTVPVVLTTNAAGAASDASVNDFGVTGLLDVSFHAAQWQPGAEPEFRITGDLRNGRVTNSALPFSLHALEGRIDWDNRRLRVSNLTAKNGVTKISLEGHIDHIGAATPAQFELAFTNMALDDRLRGRLPRNWRKVYDSLRPSGLADGGVSIRRDEHGRWRAAGLRLSVRDGTATHEKFPYTVTQVAGTVQQFDDVVEIDFAGQAGRRPVTVTGYVRGEGPECEAAFDIRAAGLPIDETFRDACPAPAAKALERLKLEGQMDLRCLLVRPANSGPPFDTRMMAHITRGAIEYADFPWRISNLRGDVTFASADGTWRFTGLQGTHGTAHVAAAGAFRKAGPQDPGQLELALKVGDAQIDKDLELALPPRLKEVWEQLAPQGKLDVAATVAWSPGEAPVVALPEIAVSEGALQLKAFPYPLDKVAARGAWTEGRLDIASFSAEHEGTRVRLDGFLENGPRGDWRLRLARLFADDLVADRPFRRALPEALRLAVERAAPQKPLSLAGMLEFRGTANPGDPVTAAWNLEAVLSGNRVTAGFDIDKAHGRLTSRGTWNGAEVRVEGNIELDSADVRGYQFTEVRGPYRMIGSRLVVGSPKAFLPEPGAIPAEERLTARIIGGTFALDSQLDVFETRRGGEDEFQHHTKIVLAQGRLEEYARQYLADGRNLQGVMNGWIDLRGRGGEATNLAGRGQLQISPAALYELPVIAQIFNVLSFVPPDRTAFKYALVDYDIDRGRFVFNRIDLVGDAISLRGRGTARFDGRLALDFYSMLPRNQVPIPVFDTLVNEVTKGWVGVEVRGTVNAPLATVKAVPELDAALKRFLSAFDGVPPARPEPRPARATQMVRPSAPRQGLPLEPQRR